MQQRIRRFGRILKLRENDRKTEQIQLAEERREEDVIQNRLEMLTDEKSHAMECFCESNGKTLSCREMWFQRQTIEVIEKHIDTGKQNLADIQNRIVDTETRLLERHRDVRLMETYVEGLRANARKGLLDAEQLELDDISVVRYIHTTKGGRDETESDERQ